MENVLGTMLRLSKRMLFSVVEIYFFLRLESDEGSCATAPFVNNNVINTNRNRGVFNQFLLVMLKISIYCAAEARNK
jgi:hypothetical protein